MRAHNPLVDASLSAAIREVIETGASARLTIGGGPLKARIGAFGQPDEDCYQLLRAVAIIETKRRRELIAPAPQPNSFRTAVIFSPPKPAAETQARRAQRRRRM